MKPWPPAKGKVLAVIFDLDGLLSDTETLHMRAYQEALSRHGVVVSDEDYARHWIRDGLGIVQYVDRERLDLDPVAMRRFKAVVYDRLLGTSLQPMPGAIELVQQLCGRVRLALASSSYRANVEYVLRALGVEGYFDAVVAGEDVEHLKPAPDSFLRAAERLGAPASACLVLEDAEKGIVAAARAGMRSIAVPNRYTRDNDFSQATWIVASLQEAGEIIETLLVT